MSKGKATDVQKSDVLQGTLDLMVLKVLDALGPQHGYGIARRIEQVSEQVLQLNEGAVYTSLLGAVSSGDGSLQIGGHRKTIARRSTTRSRRAAENSSRESPQNWERIAGVIGRVLRLEGQEQQ